MALSTKNVNSGSISKIFEPGNLKAEILSVALTPFPYKEGSYHISLFIQGPELEGFQGIPVDKANPEGEKYKGQVAYVKSNEYAYADGTTKTGISVSRDMDILKFVKNVCVESGPGAVKWFEDQDNKHDTIESFMESFDTEKPFKGVMFNLCVGGKEYTNKQGYPAFDLNLVRPGKGEKNLENAGTTNSKLVIFDSSKHIKKQAPKEFSQSDSEPVSDDTFSL